MAPRIVSGSGVYNTIAETLQAIPDPLEGHAEAFGDIGADTTRSRVSRKP